MRLKDKVAFITGGTSGIGAGIARLMHQEGAKLAIAALHVDSAQKIGSEDDTLYIHMNTTNTASVQAAFDQAIAKWGRIDILVNNAGFADGRSIEVQTEEQWDALIDTNVNGYARCARAALPHLIRSRGCVLNVSSRVALVGQANAFGYCATKGAIFSMTKSMAIDLAKYGIRVNAILPGWIATEALINDWPNHQRDPEHALEKLTRCHPLGRLGTPEDCGYAAVYLCSNEAAFITGATLDIDGGITLGYIYENMPES